MADSKKLSFSATPKSWAIVAKISQIGPWVSRIDWCKGHWFCSTHMAVRLANVSSKTGKNAFFVFLGHFWAYVGQPHGHMGWAKSMPFASINSTNPRTNPWNFHEKILRIDEARKWLLFSFLVFGYWVDQKNFFFGFLYAKNPEASYEVAFIPALWMVSSESLKRLYPN